jgi:hypothetical protein
MFVRGSIKNGNSLSHIVSEYITSVREPGMAEFFHTETEPKVQIIQLGIGLIAGIIVITATFLEFIRRRYRNQKYSALEAERSGSSETDEIPKLRSNSSFVSKYTSKLQNDSDKKTDKNLKLNTFEQKKVTTQRNNTEQGTIDSRKVNSGSIDHFEDDGSSDTPSSEVSF